MPTAPSPPGNSDSRADHPINAIVQPANHKPTPSAPTPSFGTLSRRAFLGTLAAAGTPMLAFARDTTPQGGSLFLRPGTPRSRVVQVDSPHVLSDPLVHRNLLAEMLDVLLTEVTHQPTSSHAWQSLLRRDDVIGLKFNRSGRDTIGTSPWMLAAIVRSLVNAGFEPKQIVCMEAPARPDVEFGTTLPAPGYDEAPTDFTSGADQLAAVLRQVTAIINIPFLKTHNIAGMTCGLKNLSHALVKHPARYHANKCSPYIADIVALPQIRGKLRLTIVDALRVMVEGGPDGTGEHLSDAGILLASTDPVATDAIGLLTLNDRRRLRGLPPVAASPARIPYLAHAHRIGLGIAVLHGIELGRFPL